MIDENLSTEDLPFDSDDDVSNYDFSEEEAVDVTEFMIEEIQESKKKLAELIREHKSEEITTPDLLEESVQNNPIAVTTNTQPLTTKVEPNKIANVADDFEYVRNNMIQLTKDGLTIIEDLMDFARSAQHPQLYRELTTSLKEVAIINKSILEIHKIKNELETKTSDQPTNVHNTQNNFYGTTEELLEMISKQKSINVTPTGNKNE